MKPAQRLTAAIRNPKHAGLPAIMPYLTSGYPSREGFAELLLALGRQLPHTHVPTLLVGVCATAFLFWVRKGLKPLLVRLGLAARTADMLTKAGPVAAIAWPGPSAGRPRA